MVVRGKVGERAGARVPGSATAAAPVRARAKDTVPKTGPAAESVPGMVRATVRDPAVVPAVGLGTTMARAPKETGAERVIDRGVLVRAFMIAMSRKTRIELHRTLLNCGERIKSF